MAKKIIEPKYGFPLFTKDFSTDYIIKNKRTRVSDVWSFWNYSIRMYHKKKTGVNKTFLLSLLEQSQYFYQAAEHAPIFSQPLLYYYSFLNLAKIIINMHQYLGEQVEYYHGIETKVTHTTTLETARQSILEYNPANSKYSVGYEFMKIMGDVFQPPRPHPLNINNALKACIGIHRTYCEITSQDEIFHRLLNPTLYRDGQNLIFEGEIKDCNLNLYNSLRNIYNIRTEITERHTKYILTETFNMNHYTPNRNDFWGLSDKLIKRGLWSYTDGDEYRIYISGYSLRYSSASIIYNIMFYLGSISRYHPYFFRSLLSEKNQWLISEFLKTQPMQFLHLVTSRTMGATILKSRTSNILI
jgi:hypothetical protein